MNEYMIMIYIRISHTERGSYIVSTCIQTDRDLKKEREIHSRSRYIDRTLPLQRLPPASAQNIRVALTPQPFGAFDKYR